MTLLRGCALGFPRHLPDESCCKVDRIQNDKRRQSQITLCDFIAAITQHIPDKSFQLVRCYGWNSNKMPKHEEGTIGESFNAPKKSGKTLRRARGTPGA